MRTEPDDPQQLPCPHQRQEFQCQITIPVLSLTWTLPNGDHLEFGLLRNVGDIRISLDGNYTANLTYKMNSGSDGFFFTSTLLVIEPMDELNLTCTGIHDFYLVKRTITTALSGSYILYLTHYFSRY